MAQGSRGRDADADSQATTGVEPVEEASRPGRPGPLVTMVENAARQRVQTAATSPRPEIIQHWGTGFLTAPGAPPHHSAPRSSTL